MKQEITNRTRQAINTKRHILEISLKLMKEHGFDSISIKQICVEAGVSIGAFYHHFKSKEGIIEEGYSHCDNYFQELLARDIENTSVIDEIVECILYRMEYAKLIGTDVIIQIYKSQLTSGNEFFISEGRTLPETLNKLITKAQQAGLLKADFSAEEIQEEILFISRGAIYNWCRRNGAFDLTAYCKTILLHHIYYFMEDK